MILLILLLIIWVGLGLLCKKMAEQRGRNGTTGFILGFIFGLFAVLGYLIGGDTEAKKIERLRIAMQPQTHEPK